MEKILSLWKQIEIFPSLWKTDRKIYICCGKTDRNFSISMETDRKISISMENRQKSFYLYGKTVAFPQWIAENVNEPQLTNVVHLTELRL